MVLRAERVTFFSGSRGRCDTGAWRHMHALPCCTCASACASARACAALHLARLGPAVLAAAAEDCPAHGSAPLQAAAVVAGLPVAGFIAEHPPPLADEARRPLPRLHRPGLPRYLGPTATPPAAQQNGLVWTLGIGFILTPRHMVQPAALRRWWSPLRTPPCAPRTRTRCGASRQRGRRSSRRPGRPHDTALRHGCRPALRAQQASGDGGAVRGG
jgi:hypothetical protein